MIETLPWEVDPETGAETKRFHYDYSDDSITIEDLIDIDTIGAFNYEARKQNTGRFADGMHWIGSIPLPIYQRLQKRGVFEDPKEFQKWWLSDESLPFRGRDMRV